MKNLFFGLFLFFLATTLSAQDKWSVGIQLYPNYTQPLEVGDYNDCVYKNVEEYKLSYSAGLMAERQLSKRFSLQMGIDYMETGHQIKNNEFAWGTQHNGEGSIDPSLPSGENLTIKHIYKYINTSIQAKYYFNSGKFRFYTGVGTSFAYFLKAKTKVILNDEESTNGIPEIKARKWTPHLLASAGCEYSTSSTISVFIAPQFQMAVLHNIKNDFWERKYYGIGLACGAKIDISN